MLYEYNAYTHFSTFQYIVPRSETFGKKVLNKKTSVNRFQSIGQSLQHTLASCHVRISVRQMYIWQGILLDMNRRKKKN